MILTADDKKRMNEQLYLGKELTFDDMTLLVDSIVNGEFSDSQLGAFLIAMKLKGVTAEDLAAFAAGMQKHAIKIPYNGLETMDNCGTGGDHSNTFNVSTTSAFVLAAGGVVMAKHGNRSISSKSGSADVLEELGVDIKKKPDEIANLLETIGIAFLFAPSLHPGMKAVMKVRQELATPTIFNLLGPLINPVNLTNQLMGTFAGDSIEETAAALGKLGRKKALVVHGYKGTDEANLEGATNLTLYDNGDLTSFSITPEEYGFRKSTLKEIEGGTAKENADILINVLKNKPSAHLDTVVLNAGLGFFASGKEPTIEAGIERAKACLSSGAAFDKLQQLIKQ